MHLVGYYPSLFSVLFTSKTPGLILVVSCNTVVILMCSYLSVLHSFIYLFCILFGVNFSEVDTSLTNRSNLSCG